MMKRNWVISAAALALVAVSGSVAAASIVNSKHDLSGTHASDDGRVCVYCHTPHNANAAVTAALWNREATATNFTMYSSATLDMTIANQPAGASLACLGCHDGTIAMDQLFGDPWNSPNNDFVGGGKQVGPDLSTDHPISITYDEGLDADFVARATVLTSVLPLFGAGSDQVECATCHDVHDPAIGKFERMATANSALCTTCHSK